MTYYLALIETAGNQSYIFESNRVRAQVGASELVARSCTEWVLEAVGYSPDVEPDDEFPPSTVARARWLLGQPPIECRSESDQVAEVEVVLATSGKALLLARERGPLVDVIRAVTRRAIDEAPGLDIAGAILGFKWAEQDLSEVYQRVVRDLANQRVQLMPTTARFPQLPPLATCADTGLPGTRLQQPDGREGTGHDEEVPIVRSSEIVAKRDAAKVALNRIGALVPGHRLERNTDRLDRVMRGEGMVSVIHADGNGIGQVFADLHRAFHLDEIEECATRNRTYVDQLRRFSLAIELITEEAFAGAVDAVARATSGDEATQSADEASQDATSSPSDKTLKLVPVVLGGDDVTVICDAQLSLTFTQCLVSRFCELTVSPEDCARFPADFADELGLAVLEAGSSEGQSTGFGMGAGIVATHRHFPVFSAYSLAEELTLSAKTTKAVDHRIGALDFHVLYDSATGGSLDQLRHRRSSRERDPVAGHGGPYLVTPSPADQRPEFRRLDELRARRDELRAGAHNHRSLLHSLREALLDSGDAAKSAMTALCRRAEANAELLGDGARAALDHGRDAAAEPAGGDAKPVPTLWGEDGQGNRASLIPDLIDMDQLIVETEQGES